MRISRIFKCSIHRGASGYVSSKLQEPLRSDSETNNQMMNANLRPFRTAINSQFKVKGVLVQHNFVLIKFNHASHALYNLLGLPGLSVCKKLVASKDTSSI